MHGIVHIPTLRQHLMQALPPTDDGAAATLGADLIQPSGANLTAFKQLPVSCKDHAHGEGHARAQHHGSGHKQQLLS